MHSRFKKILFITVTIFGVGVLAYIAFVGFAVYSTTKGCGMDDGPFTAISLDQPLLLKDAQTFTLSGGSELLIMNRQDSLSPIIALNDHGVMRWALDTDVRNTSGYESCRIWEISDVLVDDDTDPIRISFLARWTYGVERGSMTINRSNGKNSFCLSW